MFCSLASADNDGSADNADKTIDKLAYYMHAVNVFSKNIPQEKVYLHFDNTSYYQGDNIWFKCYVNSLDSRDTIRLSKTLYVELLNPGGEVIDKRVLPIENGECNGEFLLNRLPFYTGFYEVRAYTKYMLNFGDDAIFSRLLPVFETPKVDGDYKEMKMLEYGNRSFPMKREKPVKEKKVNMKFYPEGGNLVLGVESQVAFEATDESGNPIDITGGVFNEAQREVSRFTSKHEGRGVFAYTPGSGRHRAAVDFEGKKYLFDMPKALTQGLVVKIDNLSCPDSIEIAVQKNSDTSDCMIGMAVLNRGKFKGSYYIDVSVNEAVSFKIDKAKLNSGVSQFIFFDDKGDIISERFIFNIQNGEFIDIRAKTDKRSYEAHELVGIEFSVTDKNDNPVNTSFSLSVRDGMDEVQYQNNIMTDFLLMSEIKGYVRNPSYYFESDDENRLSELDNLLMVQGWRRHIWKESNVMEPLDIKYSLEQGIETSGQVVTFHKSQPKSGVDVNMLLLKRDDTANEDEDISEDEAANMFKSVQKNKGANSAIESLTTDNEGRFSFVSEAEGKWSMILAVKERGRAKNYNIVLDRLFSPKPRRYKYAELQTEIIETVVSRVEEEVADGFEQIADSTSVYQKEQKKESSMADGIKLDEVVVTARRKMKNMVRDIYENRSKSTVHYDVSSEIEEIKDQGKFIGDHIHDLLNTIDKNFVILTEFPIVVEVFEDNPFDITEIASARRKQYISYKGKSPLFIINANQ